MTVGAAAVAPAPTGAGRKRAAVGAGVALLAALTVASVFIGSGDITPAQV